jgi:hypothetical protein
LTGHGFNRARRDFHSARLWPRELALLRFAVLTVYWGDENGGDEKNG